MFKTLAETQLAKRNSLLAEIKQQALKAYADPAEVQYLIALALTGRQSHLSPDELAEALPALVAEVEAA